MDNYNWQASVQIIDRLRRFAHIEMFRRDADGNYLMLKLEENIFSEISYVAVTDLDVKTGFDIPINVLPALLAALSSHLGAVEHPQQLRSDYDNERKRVDKLTESIIELAIIRTYEIGKRND